MHTKLDDAIWIDSSSVHVFHSFYHFKSNLIVMFSQQDWDFVCIWHCADVCSDGQKHWLLKLLVLGTSHPTLLANHGVPCLPILTLIKVWPFNIHNEIWVRKAAVHTKKAVVAVRNSICVMPWITKWCIFSKKKTLTFYMNDYVVQTYLHRHFSWKSVSGKAANSICCHC